jgi:hypothetical protein
MGKNAQKSRESLEASRLQAWKYYDTDFCWLGIIMRAQ